MPYAITINSIIDIDFIYSMVISRQRRAFKGGSLLRVSIQSEADYSAFPVPPPPRTADDKNWISQVTDKHG